MSSSFVTDGKIAGATGVPGSEASVVEAAVLLAMRAAFFCWSSCVKDSTGSSLTMFSVAVGRRAKTVNVQSCWFCWKRRLML